MLELLQKLDTVQIVTICAGVLFLVYNFRSEIYGVFKAIYSPRVSVVKINSLTSIVAKWERLSEACKDAGLDDAHEKLQEVFPMLVKVEDE
jgi:hypothetical protein